MVSVTSGTTSFSLDVDDIIEDALDPLGSEISSGIDIAKARRKLNLILIELQNKNIPLSKINTVEISISDNDFSVDLDSNIIDVLEASIKKSSESTYVPLGRWGARDYHNIPNKGTKERPTIFSTDRLRTHEVIKFWPISNGDYTVSLLVSEKIEDVTESFQKIDLNTRYLPLLVKWLSYELSMLPINKDKELTALLKMRYEETMVDTFDEDRERVNQRVILGGISGI